MYADRFYLNGKIRVKRSTIALLRNMNNNVLQMAKEYDYSFVVRLLSEVFKNETLVNASVNTVNGKKTAYAKLDEQKYKFVLDVFEERVRRSGYTKSRLESLPKLINRRCAALRSNLLVPKKTKSNWNFPLSNWIQLCTSHGFFSKKQYSIS